MTDDVRMPPGLTVPDHMVGGAGSAEPYLVGGRCESCGDSAFPAPAQCPGCLMSPLRPHALPTQGRLYSYSVVHSGPRGWPVPYTVGYVDLPGDVRVFGHVAQTDEALLRPDLPVRLRLEPVSGDAHRATWIADGEEATDA